MAIPMCGNHLAAVQLTGFSNVLMFGCSHLGSGEHSMGASFTGHVDTSCLICARVGCPVFALTRMLNLILC